MDPAAIMSGKTRIAMKVDAASVDIGMLSLADLIRMAKLPDGAKEDQVPEMLQTLLAEHFKLTFHRQSKEQNVYALVVAKGGHKLKLADPVPAAPPAAPQPGVSAVRMSGDIQGKVVVVAGGANGDQTKVAMNNGPDSHGIFEDADYGLRRYARPLRR